MASKDTKVSTARASPRRSPAKRKPATTAEASSPEQPAAAPEPPPILGQGAEFTAAFAAAATVVATCHPIACRRVAECVDNPGVPS